MKLNEFITSTGEVLLYTGQPDLNRLELLSYGPGDIWHSSLNQGFIGLFPEIVYQSATFWYLNDFKDLDTCVSWRVNSEQFVIRKSAWHLLKGFDNDYQTTTMKGLDLGYRGLKSGVIPLYVKNLFESENNSELIISTRDRYVFYRKKYKIDHSLLMLFRKGFFNIKEWQGLLFAFQNFKIEMNPPFLAPRKLKSIEGNPTVSYIIPTMFRQDYTLRLLEDLKVQSYCVNQVIVVDATPINDRDESMYDPKDYPFELIVKWQESKGSCRARNEAIELCTGDYIVFGDDDIRIPSNFIENHIRFLQTNNSGACNGLDIRADHQKQDLQDLENKLEKLEDKRWIAGCALMFSNANSCVKREHVTQLVGNDVNFDGGYGEDGDFGMSLSKIGVVVMHNPFSVNLHLKPPSGGYRFWGLQAKVIGKKRKTQPWELDTPVKWIRPVPSPTVMYGIIKHFTKQQVLEYKYKYFFLYLFKGSKKGFIYRFLRIPYKNIQFKKSLFYARKLNDLGIRHK